MAIELMLDYYLVRLSKGRNGQIERGEKIRAQLVRGNQLFAGNKRLFTGLTTRASLELQKRSA